MNKLPPITIDASMLPNEIPLRYYRGWTISFNIALETFQSPLLCLYNFSNSKDLEKAIDEVLRLRG